MKDRIRHGWTYAPVRDNLRKLNPLLVPWDQLSEVEKEKDRDTIRNTPVSSKRQFLRSTPMADLRAAARLPTPSPRAKGGRSAWSTWKIAGADATEPPLWTDSSRRFRAGQSRAKLSLGTVRPLAGVRAYRSHPTPAENREPGPRRRRSPWPFVGQRKVQGARARR